MSVEDRMEALRKIEGMKKEIEENGVVFLLSEKVDGPLGVCAPYVKLNEEDG